MWLYWIVIVLWFIPSSILFPTKVFNKKKIPKGKCIIACNHVSGWDPVVLAVKTFHPIAYMIKASLYKSKFLKGVFNIFGCIKTERDGSDFRAIKSAIDTLNKGRTFGLFPEGTRNLEDPDHIIEFKNGASLFALKTKTQIIPVIIKRRFKVFQKNYMIMGDPIDFSEFYGEGVSSDVVAKATQKLWTEMDKLQDEFNQLLAKKYPKKFKYVPREVVVEEKATEDVSA